MNKRVAGINHENAKVCYIFKVKFENTKLKDKNYYNVRDNFHYTGKYIGDAHSICNLKQCT